MQRFLRLQSIINGANYSIISTDTTGTINSFNKVAERILAYSEAEIVVISMINLARPFKLEITAVGVENPQQLDYLLSLGCHAVQGDYINPVIQIGQAEQLLSAEPEQPAALEM